MRMERGKVDVNKDDQIIYVESSNKEFYFAIKRLLDFVLSFCGLILLSPFFC